MAAQALLQSFARRRKPIKSHLLIDIRHENEPGERRQRLLVNLLCVPLVVELISRLLFFGVAWTASMARQHEYQAGHVVRSKWGHFYNDCTSTKPQTHPASSVKATHMCLWAILELSFKSLNESITQKAFAFLLC